MTKKLVIDLDYIKYACACAGEKRTVNVHHTPSGRMKTFNTRTEFKGQGKKVGGWLEKHNQERIVKGLAPFTLDEFVFEDVQTPEPIENILHSVKMQMEGLFHKLGTRKYVGFLGRGDSFRVGISTLLKYKGQRQDLLKPLAIPEVEEYLVKKYKAEIVTDIEADDACVIACYKNDNILIAQDKDAMGTACQVYNPSYPENGVINCDVFGEIHRNEKGNVKGHGRLFHYLQVASGDTIDNYKANCMSDITWGEVAAYNTLKDCQNDADALLKLNEIYLKLYPTPKVVTGWRGYDIEIYAGYVLREVWQLATMLRRPSDRYTIDDAAADYGVYLSCL